MAVCRAVLHDRHAVGETRGIPYRPVENALDGGRLLIRAYARLPAVAFWALPGRSVVFLGPARFVPDDEIHFVPVAYADFGGAMANMGMEFVTEW